MALKCCIMSDSNATHLRGSGRHQRVFLVNFRFGYMTRLIVKLSRLVGKPGILWFSFIFSNKQRLRPLGYCASLIPCWLAGDYKKSLRPTCLKRSFLLLRVPKQEVYLMRLSKVVTSKTFILISPPGCVRQQASGGAWGRGACSQGSGLWWGWFQSIFSGIVWPIQSIDPRRVLG